MSIPVLLVVLLLTSTILLLILQYVLGIRVLLLRSSTPPSSILMASSAIRHDWNTDYHVLSTRVEKELGVVAKYYYETMSLAVPI